MVRASTRSHKNAQATEKMNGAVGDGGSEGGRGGDGIGGGMGGCGACGGGEFIQLAGQSHSALSTHARVWGVGLHCAHASEGRL